ncbi:MAG: N-acetyl-alpha-D-glucosaminyl L-malate synthase BshA [Cytophagaceae bacterium]|nr:N-acetyl-alpha-D-glucosaminyl L-malate synthase BshA [Cytophagaceae bacterium]MDW8455462.1 N-acetyl-alpha-D-glucosaminyl L-malate synthase BshA [Cytophagaceae bacterium]
MRIGIVCYPTYGGSGVVATELGKWLAQNGHQVHFITYSQPQRLDTINENIYYHEVRIRNYPLFEHAPYELALASKMVDVSIHEKLDILHVHYAIPHASAAYMAREILRTKGIYIPFITTLHGTDITLVGKDPSYEPVVTFSINQSDAVTSVSEDLKKETLEQFTINKPIVVIPNFVDISRFKKQRKDHFKKAICPNDEHLLVHVSNFRKVKRVEDVLWVFEKINQVLPSKLLLIGDGPERMRIEQLTRELNLCDNVRFLGKLDAIEEVLSVSDLFIMPSEKESFGLAALEAMACEVPVISTNVGGLPEINIDGITGYMSNVGDTQDMAKNALRILDKENLPRFKKNALEQAKKFDSNLIIPKYVELYNRILMHSTIQE